MVFALFVVPALVSGICAAAEGVKQIMAGEDLKAAEDQPTAVLGPRIITKDEYQEYKSSPDADRVREIVKTSEVRHAIYQQLKNQEAA